MSMFFQPSGRTCVRAGMTLMAAAAAVLLFAAGGCASDEPVGHTKTTTKKVIDSPTEKTTVTETHEKDTKVYPPR